jgi:hypothetical protein
MKHIMEQMERLLAEMKIGHEEGERAPFQVATKQRYWRSDCGHWCVYVCVCVCMCVCVCVIVKCKV